MQARLDSDAMTLELEFADGAELREYAAKARGDEGFLVGLEAELKLYAELEVTLMAAGERHPMPARVIQVFPSGETGFGTAFQVLEPALLELPPVAGEAQPATVSGAVEIRRMNVSQRMRLAMRGDRIERQILLRDSSPQVLMGLLGNPRLEEKEVLELVKSHHASSGVLQRVAKDRRWSSNYEVRLTLVKNPKTPPLLAKRLLPTLRRGDLKVLARSEMVREAVKGAALRLYLKRI